MTALGRLGVNDLAPCPSDSCRRRNLAHGRICYGCEPDAERFEPCSECGDRIEVVNGCFAVHPQRSPSGRLVRGWRACRGSNRRVPQREAVA